MKLEYMLCGVARRVSCICPVPGTQHKRNETRTPESNCKKNGAEFFLKNHLLSRLRNFQHFTEPELS